MLFGCHEQSQRHKILSHVKTPRNIARLPGGIFWREPWPGELRWFQDHTHVAGFAVRPSHVVLNPYVNLKPRALRSVLLNESVRIFLWRNRNYSPLQILTPWQRKKFQYYGAARYQSETILARIVAKDPSSGIPSAAQKMAAHRVAKALGVHGIIRLGSCRSWLKGIA